jgi:hypothetical protein
VRPDTTRRALLAGAGTALAATIGGCGRSAPARQAAHRLPRAVAARDIEILTRALELERRTVAAYVEGIPLLERDQARAARQFLSEELEHTGELISLITSAGGKPGPRASSYALGQPETAGEVIALLHDLEAQQVSGYLTWIPQLSPGPIRAAVASVLTVDAQHVALWRLAQGRDPVPHAFVSGAE